MNAEFRRRLERIESRGAAIDSQLEQLSGGIISDVAGAAACRFGERRQAALTDLRARLVGLARHVAFLRATAPSTARLPT